MPSLRSRAIYQAIKLFGSPFKAQYSLTQQRENLERQARLARMPAGVITEAFHIGEMHAEWVVPQRAADAGAILYLHGGGYTMGSCNTHRAMVAHIAAASNLEALLFDYRLAPEHPFPAALEDAKTVYRWLLDQGIAAHRIVFAGDSAGGGLAVALAIALRDENGELPSDIVCLSPWVDLTLSGDTITSCARADPLITQETSRLHARRYAGEHDPANPLISPVFAWLGKLPPVLIQVGEYEILRSDATRLAESACRDGVSASVEIWPGMWHVWQAYAGLLPEAGRAINAVGKFIQQRLSD
jgi:acetyl esterase/lipase